MEWNVESFFFSSLSLSAFLDCILSSFFMSSYIHVWKKKKLVLWKVSSNLLQDTIALRLGMITLSHHQDTMMSKKKMECCKIRRAYRRCVTLHVPTYIYMECACSSVHTTIKRMQECISFLRSNSKVLYKFLELLLLSLQWNLMNRLL